MFKQLIKIAISLLIILLLCGIFAQARSQLLNYTVTRNGSDAGWMKLEKKCLGNTCNLTLNAEIKLRMIFWMYASLFESAGFTNGRLIFSSQYQKLNGSVKVNKLTRFNGNGYEVIENNKKQLLTVADIYFNLLCLYFQEPVAQKQVYCDKQQCFVNIDKTTSGGYKVKFPDGNSNCFYYSRGVCTKVEIDHTFYSAEITLKQ